MENVSSLALSFHKPSPPTLPRRNRDRWTIPTPRRGLKAIARQVSGEWRVVVGTEPVMVAARGILGPGRELMTPSVSPRSALSTTRCKKYKVASCTLPCIWSLLSGRCCARRPCFQDTRILPYASYRYISICISSKVQWASYVQLFSANKSSTTSTLNAKPSSAQRFSLFSGVQGHDTWQLPLLGPKRSSSTPSRRSPRASEATRSRSPPRYVGVFLL